MTRWWRSSSTAQPSPMGAQHHLARLLAQVAAMTGTTDPGEQQSALAQLLTRLQAAEQGEREARAALALVGLQPHTLGGRERPRC